VIGFEFVAQSLRWVGGPRPNWSEGPFSALPARYAGAAAGYGRARLPPSPPRCVTCWPSTWFDRLGSCGFLAPSRCSCSHGSPPGGATPALPLAAATRPPKLLAQASLLLVLRAVFFDHWLSAVWLVGRLAGHSEPLLLHRTAGCIVVRLADRFGYRWLWAGGGHRRAPLVDPLHEEHSDSVAWLFKSWGARFFRPLQRRHQPITVFSTRACFPVLNGSLAKTGGWRRPAWFGYLVSWFAWARPRAAPRKSIGAQLDSKCSSLAIRDHDADSSPHHRIQGISIW